MLESQIFVLALLLGFSAFFSGVEAALLSLSHIKVKTLVNQKKHGADALQRVKKNPHKMIITILMGNNLVNTAAASLATVIAIQLFSSNAIGIATGVMTFLLLVFGEITPKTLATQNAEKIALWTARPLEILMWILSPIGFIFELIAKTTARLLGAKEESKLSEEEMRTMVTMSVKEGILERETAEMMHNILEFEGRKVVEIMTPRAKMEMMDGNKSVKEVLDYVLKTPYSRFPVYEENEDHILGIVEADDILKCALRKNGEKRVKDLIKKVALVPEAKEIDEMLTEFEGKKIPVALVVDEYRHVVGLITVEDILEEIVGDIFDKSKVPHRLSVKKIRTNRWIVDGTAPIGEVNKILDSNIKAKRANTIGGYIENTLGHLPKEGERLQIKKITFEVQKVTKEGIKSIKVIKE